MVLKKKSTEHTLIKIDSYSLQTLMHYAMRYCLGRTTYAPYEFRTIFLDYYQHLPKHALLNLLRDIENCKDYGMSFDKDMWMSLKKVIVQELESFPES